MRIRHEDGRLVLRHVPLNNWLFGAIFLVIGSSIAALAAGLAANYADLSPLARVGALLTGLVGAAFGLAVMFGSRIVTVSFDRVRSEVRIVRGGLFAGSKESHPLAAVRSVETVVETDAEGDAYYELLLVLQSGEKVRLTPHRLAHSPGVERMVAEVEAYLKAAWTPSAGDSQMAKDNSR